MHDRRGVCEEVEADVTSNLANVAAVLTPPGRGAVATVVVEGPDALYLVQSLFTPNGAQGLAKSRARTIRVGRWGESFGEQVVVCPISDRRIEIHCHGGAAASAAIVGRLAAAGCRTISWRQWITSHSADRIVAEALVDLAQATTERTALILLDQANGALSRAVAEVAKFIRRDDWSDAQSLVWRLLARAALGLHLVQPWRVVLAGRVNVGKSSLMNSLAGYERAIVHPTPGTTRDVVTLAAAIDGWPVEIADTAGMRPSDNALEQAGVQLARRQANQADLIVLVHDASSEWSNEDAALATRYPTALLVHNKIDLTGGVPAGRPQGLGASALRGDGIGEILAAIGRRLAPDPPPPAAAAPFRRRHVAALEAVQQRLAARDASRAAGELSALVDREMTSSSQWNMTKNR